MLSAIVFYFLAITAWYKQLFGFISLILIFLYIGLVHFLCELICNKQEDESNYRFEQTDCRRIGLAHAPHRCRICVDINYI